LPQIRRICGKPRNFWFKIELFLFDLESSADTGPPSHTLCGRGRSDFLKVGQTPKVYRYTLFLTTNPYVFWFAKFVKSCPEKSSARPRFAQRAAFGVASYGRGVGRLPPVG
jgi:hypothetical protein